MLAAALTLALGLMNGATAAQEQGGPALPQSVRPPAVRRAPNPTDPFAAIKTGTQTPVQYQAQFRYAATVDPLDPFHNWGGNLWNQTWQGQWPVAYADRQTFEQFWNSLQGQGGMSLILASPYPYTAAEEHWKA